MFIGEMYADVSTSGILEPKIDNAEVGMKLAVTGMIYILMLAMYMYDNFIIGMLRDYSVGLELIADYLLYSLNKHRKFE